ncbi:MAG: hypothetical protein ACU84Q_10605 [Gammaproteobacteria bacterium]
MDLRPKIQLASMIKAMSEVVLPAVDPDNELACEQAQLVLGMLHLMAARLPWQFHYDIDALARALELSALILETGGGGSQTQTAMQALATANAHGRKVLAGATASPEQLEETLLELRTKTADMLDALWTDGDIDCRQLIGRAAIKATQEQNVRERAWFAPQGWDTEAEAPAPLESLLKTRPEQ